MNHQIPASNNHNKENKMNTINDILGQFDREALNTSVSGRYIRVESIEDSANEIGAFAQSIMTLGGVRRLIHVTIKRDVLDPGVSEKAPTDLFVYNTSSKDVNGIVDVSSSNYELVSDMDFSFVSFDEDGIVKDDIAVNTDELELALWWPNSETVIDVVFISKGDLHIWNDMVKLGSDHDPVTLDRAKWFMDQLASIPVGFGSVEQLLKDASSSTHLHPAEIIEKAGRFKLPFHLQIVSEELIDIAVQAAKAIKRFSTLFRKGTPINEIVDTKNDPWTFYMIDANEGVSNYTLDPCFDEINAMVRGQEEELTMETLHNMNVMHHDGCIYVSPQYLPRMVQMIEDRYTRLDFSPSKKRAMVKKFKQSLTWQIRATGEGLVDQYGNAIGMEGHLKTHIMVASGAVARWMKKNKIAFFGASEAYKTDFAVKVKDHMVFLLQSKAPKFDVTLSTQFYSTILGGEQGGDFVRPMFNALQVKLDEVVNMENEDLQSFAEAMVNEDDDENELIGGVRRGANELLATYGASGLSVKDSPAAVFAVKSNLLQKFAFATLSADKNMDMSSGGYGRQIRLPIPGVRLQVFPRAFMVAGGHIMPEIEEGEFFFYGMGEDIQVGVVNDEDWKRVFVLTGGPDLDDFWEAMVFNTTDNVMKIKLQRNPAVYGEYMIFEPHFDSEDQMTEQIIAPFGQDLPVLDLAKLPVQVDRIQINGTPVVPVTLGEFYDRVIAPATGRATSENMSGDEFIMEQKKAMLTYIQIVTLSANVLIANSHMEGLRSGNVEDNWKRMEYRMILPTKAEEEAYRQEMNDPTTMDQPQKPKGVIPGIIAGILNKVNTDPTDSKYADLYTLLDPEAALPWSTRKSAGDYGDWMGEMRMIQMKQKMENSNRDFLGGNSLVRDFMEKKMEQTLRRVKEQTYNDYGIILAGQPGAMRYKRSNSGNTSQQDVPSMKGYMHDFVQGDPQKWTFLRANSIWVDRIRTNRTLKVMGLENTELGAIVHNTKVSRYVPAASVVRAMYTELYRSKVPANKSTTRPEQVMASRDAWVEAFGAVKMEMSTVEDVLEFVIALLYVLRATPHVTVSKTTSGVDKDLNGIYGRPGNVNAEEMLYKSILMNWGKDKKNVVLTAFLHLRDLVELHTDENGEFIADPDAQPFELVALKQEGSSTVNLFLPTGDNDLTLSCKNCGTGYEIAESKFASVVGRFITKDHCTACQTQA